mmetsp:Transcript_79449/g.208634  ORF Transcript_79449/g.208634 Transcript_79449/m.208634 type:complete len:247 (+) Transcript_79449:304-1044(+)
MAFQRQGLPQLHDLRGGQRVRLPQIRGREQQEADGVGDEVPAQLEDLLRQLRARPVPLQDVLELPLEVTLHVGDDVQEANGVPRGEELRVNQDVSAEVVHLLHLVLSQPGVVCVRSEPVLQELYDLGPRVVRVLRGGATDMYAAHNTRLDTAGLLVRVQVVEGRHQVNIIIAVDLPLQARDMVGVQIRVRHALCHHLLQLRQLLPWQGRGDRSGHGRQYHRHRPVCPIGLLADRSVCLSAEARPAP